MEINILIINEILNHNASSKSHFSLTKGENVAKSMAQIPNTKVYFLTTGKEETIQNVMYKKDFSEEFLKSLKVLLFIRETNIHTVLEKYPVIKQYLDTKDRQTKVGIKGDSLAWLNSRELKEYVRLNYKEEIREWGYNFFDVIYVQMEKSKIPAMKLLKQDKKNKLKCSKMGVPNEEFDFAAQLD